MIPKRQLENALRILNRENDADREDEPGLLRFLEKCKSSVGRVLLDLMHLGNGRIQDVEYVRGPQEMGLWLIDLIEEKI